MNPPPTERDHRGVDRLERAIRRHPDEHARISCFNEGEAMWIRAQLEARGIDGDRFSMAWLVLS